MSKKNGNLAKLKAEGIPIYFTHGATFDDLTEVGKDYLQALVKFSGACLEQSIHKSNYIEVKKTSKGGVEFGMMAKLHPELVQVRSGIAKGQGQHVVGKGEEPVTAVGLRWELGTLQKKGVTK